MGAPRTTGKKVGSAVWDCRSMPPMRPSPKVRCDFDLVVFRCDHCPGKGEEKRAIQSVKYWTDRKKQYDNIKRPPRGSKRKYDRLFGVATFPTNDIADHIAIELHSRVGYQCSHQHPQIAVYDHAVKRWIAERRGYRKLSVTVKSLPFRTLVGRFQLFEYIRELFFPYSTVRYYTIVTDACGGRGDGRRPLRRVKQYIGAFPGDTFKLFINIPPIGTLSHKSEYGRKYDKGFFRGDNERTVKITDEKKSRAGLRKQTITYDTTRAGGRKGPIKSATRTRAEADRKGEKQFVLDMTGRAVKPITQEPLNKEAKTDSLGSLLGETFTFERTNPRKTETTSIGALIKTILTLKKVIQEVGNFIQGFKPQIGWKFDFTMEICAGSFTYEWGYKEWVDHTIYRWWHIDISLTLLSVKLEVSFGIGLKLGRLALVGSIYGSTVSEVGIKRDLQADPDRRPTWTMPLHGKVSGELGVRLVLGDEWAMAKGFFRAGFPMEATCVCKPPEPFYIEWRVDYTGLDAVLHCSTKWFGGFEQRFVLSPPIYNYKSGNFFKAQRPRGKK